MSAVDDRIVRMQFNNSTFERAVKVTLNTLAKLKSSLNFGTKDPLAGVEKSASRFSLHGVTSAIDGVSKKFGAMSTIGIAALATLTSKAVSAGLQFVKSFTLAPIKAGFDNYETQINAIQTILANTGLKGKSGLSQVNATLAELNKYANQTVYNFSEMAKNIGTFTAAGVKLKPAAESIKGIANLAALSGSSSQQASTAMYQLSQAIASNQVHLQDWNSVVNAGLGGRVFQQALFNTGKALHTIKGVKMDETFDQWTKSGHSFRQSLQDGWITGKVLTQTLQGFTGDLTAAQLKSMGYNAQQIKQIQEMGKTAVDAATKIKTFSQLTDALKEEVATAYATIFKTLFGNINQAKTLFSSIHTTLENALTGPIYAVNKVLEGWAKLGGRTALIDGLRNAFHDLGAIIKPIKDAFREIFPPTTAKELYNLTVRFRDFMKSLKIGDDTAKNLKRTFAGVFAVFDIAKQIISGVFHVFTSLVGAIFKGNGTFLNFTGNIGDFLVHLDKMLKSGKALPAFFQHISNFGKDAVGVIKALIGWIAGLFTGKSLSGVKGLTGAFSNLGGRLSQISGIGSKVADFFRNLWTDVQPGVQKLEQALGNVWDAIKGAFSTGNFNSVLDALNAGLLGGIIVLIRKFFKDGFKVEIGGGVLDSVKETFEGLTGNLKAMQTQIKAKALLEIAGAIALITASVVALALIDSKKLTAGLQGLAVGFGELLGAMKVLTSIGGSKGFLKIPVIASGLILLSGAVLVLVLAVKSLSKLNWSELTKGLVGVGALLAGLSLAVIPLSRNSSGMIRAGVGITALAVGLNVLYLAVKNFSSLSWLELGKGLAAVAGSLVAIGAGMRLMPKGLALTGAGLLIVSGALLVIGMAVRKFGNMDWIQIGKGLAGVAGSLVVIAGAMRLMPKGIVLQAAGLILVGVALNSIAKAVAKMGGHSWTEIAKGLVALAGALAILTVSLNLMDGAVAGAAALLVAAAALRVLEPVISAFSKMSWGDMIKGFVGLAGVFAIIGGAGLLLAPVVPALLGLGAAMVLVGGGFALFGAGALAVSSALGILAAAGSAGIALLVKALDGMISLLPKFGKMLALGLTNFIVAIGNNAARIVAAFTKLLDRLLDAVIKLAPKMGKAFSALIRMLITVIRNNFPQLVATGIQMLIKLLQGIRNNIGKVTKITIDIIVRFLNTVAANLGRIIRAGTNVLLKFISGIFNNMSRVSDVTTTVVVRFLNTLARNTGRYINAGTNIVVQLVKGIGRGLSRVATAAVTAIIRFINTVGNQSVRLANAGAAAMVKFINGLAQAVRDHSQELRDAGANLGGAVLDGLTGGLYSKAQHVKDTMGNIVSGVLDKAKSILHINSPSKEFIKIGHSIGEGWTMGLNDIHGSVVGKTGDIAHGTIKTVSDSVKKLSASLNVSPDFNPRITPVLDLSQVRKDATKLGGIVKTNPISASVSYTHASDISTTRQKAAQAASDGTTVAGSAGTVIKLEQNNYSPKALSTVEIYRQTKNQLGQAKKALGLPVN